MKTLISIIILAASLGWGPATTIIEHGQGNVALANASTLNRAAQMASVQGCPFDSSGQNTQAIIEQLHSLGYLSAIDCAKMERTVGCLQPTGTFGAWSDVEFTVPSSGT